MSSKSLARTTFAAVAAAGLLTLTACGGDDDGDAGDGGSAPAANDVAPGVPEECEGVIMAVGPADLGDVESLPADWPEPPVDATLCATTSTIDDSQESIDYVTDAAPEEVLAGYEEALSSYGATREEDGLGREIVVGVADDVTFQVTADDGKFTIVLAP